MRIHFFILFLTIFSLQISLVQADSGTNTIRKTVDEQGNVVFSKSAFKKAEKESSVEPIPEPERTPPPPTTLYNSSKPTVDIYYAAWDPVSEKAIVFFRENHIVVNTYDISVDIEAAELKRKLAPDFKGIPLVVINGTVVRGVDEQKYRNALSSVKPPR